MFQKVKKFRDKIFSNPTKKDGEPDGRSGYSGDDLGSSFGSSSSKRGAASPASRKESDVHMAASPDLQFLRKSSVTSHRHNSQTSHAESPTSSALPPVQISNTSFSNNANAQHGGANNHANHGANHAHAKAPLPPALQGLLSPVAGSGRRKSTPAALDMALRTDEGKRAVEELLQGPGTGNKKLVFGQYFAGSNAVTPTAKAAEQRKHAAGASSLGPPSPTTNKLPPAPGAITAASVGLPPLTLMPTMNIDQPMTTVMEDEDIEEKNNSSGQQLHSHKTIADSVSSYDPASGGLGSAVASPNGKSANAVAHAAAQQQAQQQAAVQAVQAAAAQQAAAAAAPARDVVMEEAVPAKRTKIISMSPALPASMARKYWQLSDYNIMRKMYTGYASTVYQAMCKKTLEMVALKVYHMENLCELNHYQVYREVRVHSMLSHQHIIHLYCAFQEGMDVVLVQEYAEGGDLYRLLHKNGGRLAERQAVEMVLHPFLLSLHYLHTRGIMHRDIKPENVLFTEHRVLKLADFGLAIDLTEERAVTRAGTLDYMAPEVLRCPPKNLPQENKNNAYLHYNNSVDAWAVGVFAYELVVGFPPFAGETQLDSVDKIMNSVPEFPDKMSELAKDFVCQALKKHPGDRPTVMEMLHHPWIRTFQRRTSMRITAAPRRRSSVTYNPPSHGLGLGSGTAPNANHTGQYHNHEQIDEGPMEGEAGDVNEMTPEQIESMIRRLQVAKQQAIARESSGGKRSGSGPQPMQT